MQIKILDERIIFLINYIKLLERLFLLIGDKIGEVRGIYPLYILITIKLKSIILK